MKKLISILVAIVLLVFVGRLGLFVNNNMVKQAITEARLRNAQWQDAKATGYTSSHWLLVFDNNMIIRHWNTGVAIGHIYVIYVKSNGDITAKLKTYKKLTRRQKLKLLDELENESKKGILMNPLY